MLETTSVKTVVAAVFVFTLAHLSVNCHFYRLYFAVIRTSDTTHHMYG